MMGREEEEEVGENPRGRGIKNQIKREEKNKRRN
jgi:hypothetical protein